MQWPKKAKSGERAEPLTFVVLRARFKLFGHLLFTQAGIECGWK